MKIKNVHKLLKQTYSGWRVEAVEEKALWIQSWADEWHQELSLILWTLGDTVKLLLPGIMSLLSINRAKNVAS